jgi:hypothetical protein
MLMPLEQGFADILAEWREMREDLSWVKRMAKKQFYRERAAAIFGRLLSQGHDATKLYTSQPGQFISTKGRSHARFVPDCTRAVRL